MSQTVLCTASTSQQVARIVERLKDAGFLSSDISVLVPNDGSMRDLTIDNQTKVPEGTAAGVGTGAVLGGSLGWLAGVGALAIPGLGPFIAAGPIMAALSGAALGGAVGGFTGALIGMGIPEYEARTYEGRIRTGHSLISVHATTSASAEIAKSICEAAGAENISTSADLSTSSMP